MYKNKRSFWMNSVAAFGYRFIQLAVSGCCAAAAVWFFRHGMHSHIGSIVWANYTIGFIFLGVGWFLIESD